MLKTFRVIGYLEGASLLILLFIAMPLKYAMDLPMAVKVVGWVHGLLFIGYVGMLASVRAEYNWPGRKTITAFVAAVLPLGTFIFDRTLRKEMNQAEKLGATN